jgi:hypothetical protein
MTISIKVYQKKGYTKPTEDDYLITYGHRNFIILLDCNNSCSFKNGWFPFLICPQKSNDKPLDDQGIFQ